MATVIGLGVQFTANANGMTKGLSEADRAIQNLARQAAGAASQFDTFASSSAAAAQAQQQVATDIAFLNSAFRTGQISAEEYVAELKAIVTSANGAAAAFQEGAAITERVATAEEKRSATLARLAQLLEQGAISQQVYERAAADASGANDEAAKAEKARADALARAAQITKANLTPQQAYDQEVQELHQHLQAGRISQDTYNAALNKAKASFDKAAAAAKKYDAAADTAGKGNTLAFNELSGILSALPGPIGNVTGRLSGLASAGEGLSRVFAGGLQQGFSSLAASAASLVNPFTLAIGGVAAFGGAAAAVAAGLSSLESRVEQLGFAAEQLGTDFSTIQVLEEAAKRTGVSFETLTTGLQKFGVKLNESKNSSSEAAKALARLGISQEDLIGLSLPAAADKVATALARVEDPAERAALQLELLGRGGESLRRGFSAIEESNTALDTFNARLTDVDAANLQEVGKAFDDVKTAIQGLTQNVLLPFGKQFADTATVLSRSIGVINNTIPALADNINILPPQFQAASTVMGFFADRLKQVESQAGSTATALGDVRPAQDEALAVSQPEGFTNFESAISTTRQALDKAIKESVQFGQAGFDAAYQFQEALKRLQQQAEDGVLNENAYKQEVERATEAYNSQIQTLKDAAKEDEARAEAAKRAAEAAIESDKKRAESALERLRIEQEFGGDSERFQAAENVLAIEREIFRVENEQADAIASNDAVAAAAAAARLAQLEQVAARERDIASGVAKQREESDKKAREEADRRAKAEEQAAKKIADLQERYEERLLDIQSERLDNLNRRSQQALTGNDLRSSEGISQFLALATGREDPAIAEYRKQLKELQDIKREIAKAAAAPVDIAG